MGAQSFTFSDILASFELSCTMSHVVIISEFDLSKTIITILFLISLTVIKGTPWDETFSMLSILKIQFI